MGANLTEKALQRAARSANTYSLCKQFDNESTSHSTRSDRNDVQKVVSAVLNNNLLKFQDDVSTPCLTGKRRKQLSG